LQFADLKQKITSDPLYREAFKISKSRSIVMEDHRMNVYLIIKYFLANLPSGNIIEFGAYRGGNAIFMAYVINELYPGMKVFALDSFEGMPPTDKTVDAHNKGDFSDTNYDELLQYIDKIGLHNIEFVKGYFEDTFDQVIAKAKPINLAHIDCDVYPSVKFSYLAVKQHMVNGGYVVLDDATVSSCIGATEAVEEVIIQNDGLYSEQIYPHYVFRIFSSH